MRRLNWNYARRRYADRRWLMVGAVALIGCVHALAWRDTLLAQRDSLVEQARYAPGRGVARPAPAVSATPAALDAVFVELRYPWTDLLDHLRVATQPGVELLTLEPEAGARQRIRISGLAAQPQQVLDFVTALQKDPAWSAVQLVSQARNDAMQPAAATPTPPLPGLLSQGAGSPALTFALVAEWRQP
jgi:hypothetical protein